MADPVSPSLSILPILLTASQSFSFLQQKSQLLHRYSDEIDRLRTKVDVQAQCFKGQIYHLVLDTLGNQAWPLLSDDDHLDWRNRDLNGTFTSHMGGNL